MSLDLHSVDARLQGELRTLLERLRAGGEPELAATVVRMSRSWKRGLDERTARIEVLAGARRVKPSSASVVFALSLPIHTFSEANLHLHHMQRHKLIGDQRPVVAMAMRAHGRRAGLRVQPPCTVQLTRLAPDALDVGDNLAMALKHVRDGVADWLGIDDRSDSVHWVYLQQQTRNYGVLIDVVL